MAAKTTKNIIIIIPCYNEHESFPYTLKALKEIRKSLIPDYKIDVLFVNDGSFDNTQELIEKSTMKDPGIYYREFAKNAGHQSALRAGLNASVSYDAVIMMDADMQHPPKLIPKMIKEWESGFKIVQMIRDDNSRELGTVRFAVRRLYYYLINSISDLKLEYGASDFRIIDKSVTKTVASSPERDLFLRGYFSWLPVSRTAIIYKPSKRIAGTSKYTLKKLYKLTYNSILQFSEKPLRIAVVLGILMALAAILYGIVLAVLYLFGKHNVSGWSSLMIMMLFCFGINFVLLGIIGHYLAHSISLQKQRPEFVVAKEKLPNLE